MSVKTPPRQDPAADSLTAAHHISRQLASRLGPHKYDMWFGHTKLQVEGRRLEVATDSPFVAKWIDAHFSEDLRGIARETLGRDAQIDVRVAPDMFGRDSEPHPDQEDADRHGPGPRTAHGRSAAARHDHGRAEPHVPQERRRGHRRAANLRRLNEFVVGPSNRLAFSAACRLIEEPDSAAVSPLFIHGECGLGKTHLLQGICRRFARNSGRADHVRYVTGEQFTNEYIASIRGNSVDAFRRRIRKLDLLAIDDVHFLSNKVRTQSEFLHTLDEIDLTGARVVLASDEHPRLIKKFSQALISRFLSGMVVQIQTPDRQTRVAIVRKLAAARSLPINDAAVAAIASRCVGSVRELEGSITKLAALHSLIGAAGGNGETKAGSGDAPAGDEEIGLVLVEQLFQDHGWQPATPVRIGTVIDTICQRLGIGRVDLMGSSRHRRVVLGRALVAYLGREMTTHSYPEIARALGRSYHSTVHTAEQRLRRQMDEDQTVEPGDAQHRLPLRELVDQLRHEITRATVRA